MLGSLLKLDIFVKLLRFLSTCTKHKRFFDNLEKLEKVGFLPEMYMYIFSI